MLASQLQYQFVLELYPEEQEEEKKPLATVPAQPLDWQPALHCARWAAVRRDPCESVVLDTGGGVIEPLWHPEVGEPYLSGVRVGFPDLPHSHASIRIPTRYFQPAAIAAGQSLVKQGKLEQGDRFRYLVCAYARQNSELTTATGPPMSLTVESLPEPIHLAQHSLDEFLSRSSPYGEQKQSDMPVFIPEQVLQEAVGLTRQAGAAETGGILIGHLHRDTRRPEVYLEVTAQIPATHAEQELTSLTFTPDTWAAVDAARDLRGKDEIYLGWWHSHPIRQWCSQCPEDKRRKCRLTGEFFSIHDAALHRCCFPRAYSVALVISDAYATGLTAALFGWRNGMVAPRGFNILEARDAVSPPPAPMT
jgi:hypothetical protein